MPQGFLAVSSEPGKEVTLEEFQDWYNEEHVPLRLNNLRSFLNGARYSAYDNETPSWLALYDINDTSTFTKDEYTRLRANRSPREADLVKRLALLDRRTYEALEDSGPSSLTSSMNYSNNPSNGLITHGMTGDLDGIRHGQPISTFHCIDHLKTGQTVGNTPEEQVVPEYMAVHEFVQPAQTRAESVRPVVDHAAASSNICVVEERFWQLYRVYPCLAQGNLPDASQ
ncbi:hypothetical protein BD626DRAFT_550431 [Schizophyllum amplum]|uniref:EthD domain-containing protein n=1 Tax=Schizophyllum amplum TaxID=97359 RepID=A0A550C2P1_9AGAR|nr:hypothetical protein BD626DRAFT_550431 [Auriculariopsis ampla]